MNVRKKGTYSNYVFWDFFLQQQYFKNNLQLAFEDIRLFVC